MELKIIGVLGAGQMGAGIAQVAAQAGYKTVLCDISDAALKKGSDVITKSLSKLAEKGKIKNPADVLSLLEMTTDKSALANCDFVIEAVTENVNTKLKIFAELDQICKPSAILASNTSSISITKIAGATKRPEQIVGMHFMNPVPLMTLVELIRALQTSDATYLTTKTLSEKMGKTTIVSKDSPGFIVNRILVPMLNEAIYTLYNGIGTVEDIDAGLKLGTNQPMGPLTLADFVGLDTLLSILEVFEAAYGDKFKPCPLLKQYVDAGWLGKKSGRGFYKY